MTAEPTSQPSWVFFAFCKVELFQEKFTLLETQRNLNSRASKFVSNLTKPILLRLQRHVASWKREMQGPPVDSRLLLPKSYPCLKPALRGKIGTRIHGH
jgi:hypothetical protein